MKNKFTDDVAKFKSLKSLLVRRMDKYSVILKDSKGNEDYLRGAIFGFNMSKTYLVQMFDSLIAEYETMEAELSDYNKKNG